MLVLTSIILSVDLLESLNVLDIVLCPTVIFLWLGPCHHGFSTIIGIPLGKFAESLETISALFGKKISHVGFSCHHVRLCGID